VYVTTGSTQANSGWIAFLANVGLRSLYPAKSVTISRQFHPHSDKMAHGDKDLQPSLTASRTIALVASALGLCTACFNIPTRPSTPPVPPVPVRLQIAVPKMKFSTTVGSSIRSEPITVTNISNQPVDLELQQPYALYYRGASLQGFKTETTCTRTLAPNAYCSVVLIFSPGQLGHFRGQLDITAMPAEYHDIFFAGEAVRP
jgi:hypothetical protein